jgi:hypothetical protein
VTAHLSAEFPYLQYDTAFLRSKYDRCSCNHKQIHPQTGDTDLLCSACALLQPHRRFKAGAVPVAFEKVEVDLH